MIDLFRLHFSNDGVFFNEPIRYSSEPEPPKNKDLEHSTR
jgi:hypothetical protein